MHQLDLNINPIDFIDKDILEILHIQDAPEEKKKEILDDMLATIENRVVARLLDHLDDAELDALEVLIDADKQDEIETFLMDKKFNIKQVTAEEALNYKAEIINLIKAKKAG